MSANSQLQMDRCSISMCIGKSSPYIPFRDALDRVALYLPRTFSNSFLAQSTSLLVAFLALAAQTNASLSKTKAQVGGARCWSILRAQCDWPGDARARGASSEDLFRSFVDHRGRNAGFEDVVWSSAAARVFIGCTLPWMLRDV